MPLDSEEAREKRREGDKGLKGQGRGKRGKENACSHMEEMGSRINATEAGIQARSELEQTSSQRKLNTKGLQRAK